MGMGVMRTPWFANAAIGRRHLDERSLRGADGDRQVLRQRRRDPQALRVVHDLARTERRHQSNRRDVARILERFTQGDHPAVFAVVVLRLVRRLVRAGGKARR